MGKADLVTEPHLHHDLSPPVGFEGTGPKQSAEFQERRLIDVSIGQSIGSTLTTVASRGGEAVHPLTLFPTVTGTTYSFHQWETGPGNTPDPSLVVSRCASAARERGLGIRLGPAPLIRPSFRDGFLFQTNRSACFWPRAPHFPNAPCALRTSASRGQAPPVWAVDR